VENRNNEAFVQALAGRKRGGTIENWAVRSFDGIEESNIPPFQIVYGHCFDDPQRRWRNGNTMRTSPIVELNEKDGYVVTVNTFYTLGEKADDEKAKSLISGIYI